MKIRVNMDLTNPTLDHLRDEFAARATQNADGTITLDQLTATPIHIGSLRIAWHVTDKKSLFNQTLIPGKRSKDEVITQIAEQRVEETLTDKQVKAIINSSQTAHAVNTVDLKY